MLKGWHICSKNDTAIAPGMSLFALKKAVKLLSFHNVWGMK